MKEEFAGHLSRVLWDGTDLQLQTEVRYKPEPRLVIIFVADGVVISRVEKAWHRAGNSAQEHNRIRDFHKRLTNALERLRNKAYIELDELKKVAVRLVNAAMQIKGPRNRAEDALSLIPGSQWAAIINKQTEEMEEAPASSETARWKASMLKTVHLAGQINALLDADGVSDICLKTESGFVLIGESDGELLISKTSPEIMPVARQMVLRLQKTLLK